MFTKLIMLCEGKVCVCVCVCAHVCVHVSVVRQHIKGSGYRPVNRKFDGSIPTQNTLVLLVLS